MKQVLKGSSTLIERTKRVKTIFTDVNEIAHLWANKRQDNARNSSQTFYFNGNTIYSYGSHFPIARHYEDKVLFTLRTYSVSTAKHINIVRSATSHLDKIYCYYLPTSKSDTCTHERNVKQWIDNVKTEIVRLYKARKPEMYIAIIEREIAKMQTYCTLFGYKLKASEKKILALTTKEDFLALGKKDIETQLKAEKKEAQFNKDVQTKGRKIYEGYLVAWRNFNSTEYMKQLTSSEDRLFNVYRNSIDNNVTYLRYNTTEIETSKKVKIPLDVAKRFYTWFKSIKDKGCIDCNKEILGYSVRSANVDGLVVGCHNISINEINLIASKLNW